MPALPVGRDEATGKQASGSRPIRVYNVDTEAVPPFGAMEIAGWDSDRRAFKVQRCTISGRNDLIFNGLNPIPAGMEGQARSDVQNTAAFTPSDGRNPLPGDVWGVAVGEWLLSPRYPGYTILDTTTAVRGFCVVVSQRANITEFIRVNGTPTPGAGVTIPSEWVQAELILFDPLLDVWGTPSPQTPVFFRDLSGLAGYYDASGSPCISLANRVGFAYGQPLYVGKAQCSTTTSTSTTSTTTTLPPCTGSCKWDFNYSTSMWGKTSSTCSTGCHCFAPSFCPAGGGPSCTYTNCGTFLADQIPPNCTGTTTTPGPSCTTTTTTPGPECSAGCTFFCHPARGWVQISDGCAVTCPCSAPSAACLGGCNEITTPCVPPPPPPPPFCTGNCRWAWVTPPTGGNFWYQLAASCASSGVANCYCDPPAVDGTICAQEVTTQCYVHQTTGTTTTRNPCDQAPTTTTTPGPGNCDTVTCLWGTTDGVNWNNILRQCVGCTCSQPPSNPTDTCQQQEMPCVIPTTTSTTTTFPPPCGYSCEKCNCCFYCLDQGAGYQWYIGSDACYDPTNPGQGIGCQRCAGSGYMNANYPCNQAISQSAAFYQCIPCGACSGGDCTTTTTTSTTTTKGPDCATCIGFCSYRCTVIGGVGTWNLIGTCSGCPCCDTAGPCNSNGNVENLRCGDPLACCPSTTTTTTTAAPTTTTTTTTAAPTTTTTTTTASGTTTTTTTTTTASGGTVQWWTGGTCGASGTCCQTAGGGCGGTSTGTTYATCTACVAAHPSALQCAGPPACSPP